MALPDVLKNATSSLSAESAPTGDPALHTTHNTTHDGQSRSDDVLSSDTSSTATTLGFTSFIPAVTTPSPPSSSNLSGTNPDLTLSSISNSSTSHRHRSSTVDSSTISTSNTVVTIPAQQPTDSTGINPPVASDSPLLPSTSSDLLTSIPTSTSSAASASQSSNSFFSNKPAVIGTFTAVGIIALALLAFLALQISKCNNRRRARVKEEENDEVIAEYATKPQEGNNGASSVPGFLNDSGDGVRPRATAAVLGADAWGNVKSSGGDPSEKRGHPPESEGYGHGYGANSGGAYGYTAADLDTLAAGYATPQSNPNSDSSLIHGESRYASFQSTSSPYTYANNANQSGVSLAASAKSYGSMGQIPAPVSHTDAYLYGGSYGDGGVGASYHEMPSAPPAVVPTGGLAGVGAGPAASHPGLTRTKSNASALGKEAFRKSVSGSSGFSIPASTSPVPLPSPYVTQMSDQSSALGRAAFGQPVTQSRAFGVSAPASPVPSPFTTQSDQSSALGREAFKQSPVSTLSSSHLMQSTDYSSSLPYLSQAQGTASTSSPWGQGSPGFAAFDASQQSTSTSTMRQDSILSFQNPPERRQGQGLPNPFD